MQSPDTLHGCPGAVGLRRITISAAFVFALTIDAALAGINEWTRIGLEGVDVPVLASDPASPSTLYANTSAGLLKSVDGGSSWSALRLGAAGSVTALAVDRTDPETVYAAVNGGSSYSSAPTDGIYRSVDGGTTFARVYVPEATAQSFGKVVALAATQSGVVAAVDMKFGCARDFCFGWGGRTVRSIDRGEIWEGGTPSFRARAFAVSPDGATLYAGAFDSGSFFGGHSGGGVYKSDDGGGTWARAGDVGPYEFQSVAVDPSDPLTVYASARLGGVYKSTDGGRTWGEFGTADVGSLVVDRSQPNVLYGTPREDFGVLQSGDGGASWFPLASLGVYVRTLATSAFDPTLLYAGTEFGVFTLNRVAQPCAATATALCLNRGRFKVEATWRTAGGRSGQGQAVPLTSDTGAFWFRTPADVELVVKVLQGPSPDSFWVFGGALTDVEYTIEVEDTLTGEARGYHSAQGRMSSFADTEAFPVDATSAPREIEERSAPIESGAAYLGQSAGCAAEPAALCLGGGRFRVDVAWQTRGGRRGAGTAVPLTADSGYFWFFDESNVELVIKVLDGGPINGHFWVFYGALTDVAYTITVTDTQTGVIRTYTNPLGALASVGDTKAF